MAYVDGGVSGPIEELPSYVAMAAPSRRAAVREEPVSLADLAARHGQRIAALGHAVRQVAAAALPTGLFVTLHTSTVVITRTVRVPTPEVANVLQRWQAGLPGGTVALPRGHAVLGTVRRDVRQPALWRLDTTIVGLRRLRPVRLELTIGPWTERATQLDLRPPRVLRASRRYFRVGHGLLDTVVQTVLDRG